jgi:conjugative transposon TraK protein
MSQLTSLYKLENSNKTLRIVLIATIACSALVNAICFFKATNTIDKIRQSVYVPLRGESMEMMVSKNFMDNRPSEMKNHIKMFHDLFWNISADPKLIEENIVKRALFLGDKSVRAAHKLREEKKFYLNIIGMDGYQTIHLDSIVLETNVYPYAAKIYGVVRTARASLIEVRRYLATCNLEDVPNRSENNPHALMITNYFPDNSQILETYAKDKQ